MSIRALVVVLLLGLAFVAPAGGITTATAAGNEAPSVVQAVEFEGTVEVTFDDGVVQAQTHPANGTSGTGDPLEESNVTVYVDGTAYGDESDFDLQHRSGTAGGNETVALSIIPGDAWGDLDGSQNVSVHVDTVRADASGGAVARPGNVTVQTTSSVVRGGGASGTLQDATRVVRGEVLALRGAQSESYTFRPLGELIEKPRNRETTIPLEGERETPPPIDGPVEGTGTFGNSTVVALDTSAYLGGQSYLVEFGRSGDQYVNLTEPTATVERTVDLDRDGTDESVGVQAAAGQEIAGTTTVPPGTELEVRVTGTDSGSPFVKPLGATVQSDGTFAATGDFADIARGANFTVDVRLNETSLLSEPVDGRVDSKPTASLMFNDQESAGERVVVQSVTTSNGGFVTIRPNATGPVLGRTGYLEAGSTSDVEIALDSRLTRDRTLVAMVHQDTDGDQTYEFTPGSSVDAPYSENGSAVVDFARITYGLQPAVSLGDQHSGTDAVTVSTVSVPDGGFVSLRSGDRRGPVLGTSEVLPPGTHTNVTVETDGSLDDGDRIVAGLHRDTDADGRFDYDLPRSRNISAVVPGQSGRIRNGPNATSTADLVAAHVDALKDANTFESRTSRDFWSDTDETAPTMNESTTYAMDLSGDRSRSRIFNGDPDDGVIVRRYQERQVLYTWWTGYGNEHYEVETNASLDAGQDVIDASAAAGLDTFPHDVNYTYTGRATHDGRTVRRYIAHGSEVSSTAAVSHGDAEDGFVELFVDDSGLIRGYRVSLTSQPADTRQERTTVTFDLEQAGEPFPMPDWLETTREQAGADCSGTTVVDAGYRQQCVLVTDAATVTNQTPPTARDDRYTTSANSRLVVEAPGLLANDSDPDGDTLTVDQTPVADFDFGTVQLRANGSFAFVPSANETGSAQFTYRIRDGEGGTDTASVLVEVRDDADGGDETADDETVQGGDGEENQTDQGDDREEDETGQGEDGDDQTEQDDGGADDEIDQGGDGDNQTDQDDDSGDQTNPAGGGGGGDASVGVTRSSTDGDLDSLDQTPSPTPSPTVTPAPTSSATATANSPAMATVENAAESEDAAASAPETTNRDSSEQVIEVGGFGGGLPILVGGAVSLGFLGAVWLWRQY